MRIREGFRLKKIVDEWVVFSTGKRAIDYKGTLLLNDVAAIIFSGIKNGKNREEILDSLLSEYDIDRATAEKDIDEYVKQLKELNIIE